MKQSVLFFYLFLILCFLYNGCTQQIIPPGVEPIRLALKYNNFANPEDLTLDVKHTYVFKSEDGNDYALIIRNANEFMVDVAKHFTVRANETGAPVTFTVSNPGSGEYEIQIYCITDNQWPDAPPKIIVRSER